MEGPKEPFEKLRSLLERKRLYQSLIESGGEMLCKSDNSELFNFFPRELDQDRGLVGLIKAIEDSVVPTSNTKILGNFNAENERFFFQGELAVLSKSEGVLSLATDVFKLQRRRTMRVLIPPSFPIYISILKHNNSNTHMDFKIADLSAGGLRLYSLQEGLQLNVGDTIEGVLHPSTGKTVPMCLIVRHLQSQVMNQKIVIHYGCEVIKTTPWITNRLLGLTLDIQQRIITGGYNV